MLPWHPARVWLAALAIGFVSRSSTEPALQNLCYSIASTDNDSSEDGWLLSKGKRRLLQIHKVCTGLFQLTMPAVTQLQLVQVWMGPSDWAELMLGAQVLRVTAQSSASLLNVSVDLAIQDVHVFYSNQLSEPNVDILQITYTSVEQTPVRISSAVYIIPAAVVVLMLSALLACRCKRHLCNDTLRKRPYYVLVRQRQLVDGQRENELNEVRTSTPIQTLAEPVAFARAAAGNAALPKNRLLPSERAASSRVDAAVDGLSKPWLPLEMAEINLRLNGPIRTRRELAAFSPSLGNISEEDDSAPQPRTPSAERCYRNPNQIPTFTKRPIPPDWIDEINGRPHSRHSLTARPPQLAPLMATHAVSHA